MSIDGDFCLDNRWLFYSLGNVHSMQGLGAKRFMLVVKGDLYVQVDRSGQGTNAQVGKPSV